MKTVRADFARQRTIGRWWWGAIAAGVSLTCALAWNRASSTRAAATLGAEQVAHEESFKAPRDVSTAAPPTAPKAYDLSAREMLQQHGTPWPLLLDAMEAVSLPGVRVVNVDYAASEAQARIEIAVVQQALALEFVAALNSGLPVSDTAWRWSVLRIEQSRTDGAARAVLLARWVKR